mmetsp:Transcript_31390/g.94184  ORF Transcript_31390/g.94184 Transcript_31390/m.94184 type:complete len:219 (-) Transcript_31390:72-728(-)
MALLILSLSWLTQAGAHGVRLRGSWRGDDAAVARRGDETAAAFARDDAAARDGGPAIVDADATARRLSPSYDDDILAELSSNPLLMMFAILLLFGGGSCWNYFCLALCCESCEGRPPSLLETALCLFCFRSRRRDRRARYSGRFHDEYDDDRGCCGCGRRRARPIYVVGGPCPQYGAPGYALQGAAVLPSAPRPSAPRPSAPPAEYGVPLAEPVYPKY